MKKKNCVFLTLLLVFGIVVCFASCDLFQTGFPATPNNPNNPNEPPVETNQTPFTSDYTIGNLNQTAGSVTAVTITPNSGKSPSEVRNIRYAGNSSIPQTAGTYAVIFDVGAAPGWNAAAGLSAGNLTVNAVGDTTKTPVSGDYTFGNMNQSAGNVTAVSITPNSGKSPGAVSNIRYNSSTTVPQTAGTYMVTFDVAGASGWYAASGLLAGILTVTQLGGGNPSSGSIYQTPDGFQYTETTTAVTIVGYVGTSKNVTIPAQINGKPVTAIGDRAFFEKQLTGVTIPSSVTTIGFAAFSNNQLTSFTIPNNVTSIGDFAFSQNQLTSVNIGNSVVTIGEEAFGQNQLTNVTIPNSVITIGDYAFWTNKLTNVNIGNSVTTIKNNAFAENQLASVIIPDSVKTIERGVFRYNLTWVNNNLVSVTIGADVTLGGFYDENSSPSFPGNLDSVYNKNGKQKGTYTRVNTSIEVWTLTGGGNPPGGGTQTFGDFLYTETATEVTITGYTGTSKDVSIPAQINGKPVRTIADGYNYGNGVFQNKQLTSVSIPNSVTTIGEYAFYGNRLTSVTIPNGVITIGLDAFMYNQLTSVSIGNTVKIIDHGAFQDNQLTEVIIPNSVTTIGPVAFCNNQIATVIIGNSVKTIGYCAFTDNKLTSVTIPDSVTTIALEAFSINQLTSVTIGAGVILGNFSITDNVFVPAFLGDLDSVYNNNGKLKGTYTRPNASSTAWTKQ